MAVKNWLQYRPGEANILGAKINLLNYAQTITCMENAIHAKTPITIGFTNVYTIMRAREDHELMQMIENFTLSVPDGMPLVWLSKYTDTPLDSRVYGPDLFV